MISLITGLLHDLLSTVASEVAYLALGNLAVCWAERLCELYLESLLSAG